MKLFLFFLLFSFLSYLSIFIIRRWLEKRQILDNPNQRSSHTIPTPRGGGLAIVVLVLLTALGSALHSGDWVRTLVYVVSGAALAYLGWQDDVRSLSPKVRFPVQGLVAAITILGMGYFKSVTIPLLGVLPLGYVGIPITFLWILGLVNAFNFMDGIDGISGGVALAGGLAWVMIALLAGGFNSPLALWVALAVAASSLGFLGHNWSPAKTFMGDVASTFLGYSFAVLPLLSAQVGGDALLFGTLVMWTYIMDAGITFICRVARREKVFEAHRMHLYQRMVIGGCTHAAVSGLYISLTVLAGLLAYGWIKANPLAGPLILLGLPLTWALLSRFTPPPEHAG